MGVPPDQAAKLALAESLERGAAAGRVEYYAGLAAREGLTGRVLDLGCGNGYAVDAWRTAGHWAVGVDNSRYRFFRWCSEKAGGRGLVRADAKRLPFRSGAFRVVVSSGMIEHIGVAESTPPYRVVAMPDRESGRAAVALEALRVTSERGVAFIDCPNGAFPVDFWHGDRVGSFRIHPIPDALLPTLSDVTAWLRGSGVQPKLMPIGKRLRFRQIASRWWGRLLRLPVRVGLALLDRFVGRVDDRFLSVLLPFLVLRLEHSAADEGTGTSST